MIRVAIAEDNVPCAQQLRQYLYDLGKETGQSFQIIHYDNGEDLLEQYQSQFDLLILDIEMPFVDGMQAAEYIRRIDQRVMIVFVTSLAQYAIQGYTVHALDYILKPVNYFSFVQRIKHALTYLHNQEDSYLTVAVKGGTLRLNAGSICYVERRTYQLVIHSKSGIYTTKSSLQQIEDNLQGYNFFRCNKGCLVNLAYVEGIQNGCALILGDLLPISRTRRTEFLAALNRYVGEAVY